MPDYQKMYICLFNKMTDVIEELQQAQKDTERIYLESAASVPLVLDPKGAGGPGGSKGPLSDEKEASAGRTAR